MRRVSLLIAIVSTALVTACSTPGTRVVLLPQPDGKPSAVVVHSKGGEETLSEPFQRATAAKGAGGAPVLDKADPDRIKADNKTLFDLMPPPGQQFTVYFDAGGIVLTEASRAALNQALAAALARSGGEIVVTGHTDTVGTTARNDELSQVRATQVRLIFLDRGFPPDRVEAVGRGKRELAVPTPDEVDEPRNRRVTIEVR
jgi:outer membrane protein OmpA-like peptidoglycan-associated protein